MFFCGKCIEIGYQFLTCTGSGKHVDPLILLPGLDRGKLQQIADHLAVMVACLVAAFDHMLVVDKYDPGLLCRTDIIMLLLRRKQKRLAKNGIFIEFIDHVLISLGVTAVKYRPAIEDQTDLFHGV